MPEDADRYAAGMRDWLQTAQPLHNTAASVFLLYRRKAQDTNDKGILTSVQLCWRGTLNIYFVFASFPFQIHRDGNSSLGKVFLQSYQQPMDHVSLTGLTPITMLLEVGLDKMRKDYINYLIGTSDLIGAQQTI